MATAAKTKVAVKQSLCKKLVGILKKYYKGSPQKTDYSVIETILYGICLEDASCEDAEAAYQRLKSSFCDYNEMRVSSISELTDLFDGLTNPEKRGLQVRGMLQYIFEKSFDFDFESLRRKTLEQGIRQLGRVKDLSSFVRLFTLQNILGGHLVPLDCITRNVTVWLGYLDYDLPVDEASEAIKSVVKKPDVALYTHFVRLLATDARFLRQFSELHFKKEAKAIDLNLVQGRLTKLLTKSKTSTTRKKTTKKSPAEKTKATSRKKKKVAKPARKKSSAAKKKAGKKKVVKKKIVKKKKVTKKTKKKKPAKKVTSSKKSVKKTAVKKKKKPSRKK